MNVTAKRAEPRKQNTTIYSLLDGINKHTCMFTEAFHRHGQAHGPGLAGLTGSHLGCDLL